VWHVLGKMLPLLRNHYPHRSPKLMNRTMLLRPSKPATARNRPSRVLRTVRSNLPVVPSPSTADWMKTVLPTQNSSASHYYELPAIVVGAGAAVSSIQPAFQVSDPRNVKEVKRGKGRMQNKASEQLNTCSYLFLCSILFNFLRTQRTITNHAQCTRPNHPFRSHQPSPTFRL
jgi:hypothetical protein